MERISEFILSYTLNSSWQIAVIWIVAALGAFLLKNGPARYRHVLWLVALAACVVVPLVPATDPFPSEKSVVTSPPTALGIDETDPAVNRVARRPARRTQIVSTTSRTALYLTLGYFLFLIWRGIRLVRFWLRKERLRRSAAPDVPFEIDQVAQRCREIFGLANVFVGRSSVACVPYTIGARRPLIILPEVFCRAGDDRLLSIIGHEMAHVSRRDYLTNLLCELVALPISFHPLTFLIKRQIDRARELACDELVSERLLPPKLYARSLVWAADVSMQRSQAFMLSMFDGQSLEERVMRLTRKRVTLSHSAARAIMMTTFFALCVSALSISMFSFELRTQARTALAPAMPVTENINVPATTPALTPVPQSRAENAINASSAEERAEAACQAGRNGDVQKIPMLIALLADDSKTQLRRCWATGRWSPALETFKHPSPGEQAAIALASLGHPAFVPLTNQLDNSNAAVRRNAAWAIGELTNMPPDERDGAVPQLITLLADSDEWVRMAAARALGELRDRSAVEKLIATVSDRDWRVRELAVWALSELKDKRAVAALCSVLLADARVEVRRGAADALGEIRNAEALPSLKQALNDPAVSSRAQWAISEIEDTDGQ